MHHIYQVKWMPTIGEILNAYPDKRLDAIEYDRYAIGTYRIQKEEDVEERDVVGHAPIELSSLLFHFLELDKNNIIKVPMTGKRKR